jgi:hypothetical protein
MNRRLVRSLSFALGFALALGLGLMLVEEPPAQAAVPPPDPINPLHGCVYERALISPVADSGGFAGQYVAQLPCGEGRYIVSGSCYVQFVHANDGDYALTGSHPYENAGDSDVPEWGEAHELVDGQNGWACRVSDDPWATESIRAKIAVGAMCCY